MALIRSIATVGSMTLVSRVLGFVRDILVAAVLGAGWMADVFFVAFKLPNLFRRLFAEGAFNLAFVPIYAGKLESDGAGVADAFARQALSVLLWSLLGFVVLVELAMPWVLMGFAPGFIADAQKFDLAVTLTRITFPYLLFISLVSLLAGVLNSHGRFAAAAATPILLNVCLIGAVLVLVPEMPSPAHALAWGVFGAGAVQFGWLAWRVRALGVRLTLVKPVLSDDIKILLRRMVPVALGAGIYQLNLLLDTVIASLLPSGSISYLFFADRVTQLPLGVVGVAVGTALLPMLSRQLRAGDGAAAQESQNRAIEFALLLTLPAAFALAALAEPIVITLFARGAFSISDAVLTAQALAVYAAGIPAYVLVKAFAPGFFAREDTKTPVKAAVVGMVVNVVLSLLLMGPFQHVGIAAATATAAWLNAAILGVVLARRGHLHIDTRLRRALPRIIVSALGMTAVLVAVFFALADGFVGSELDRISALAAIVVSGVVTFGILIQVTGAARWQDLRRALSRAPAAPVQD